MYYHLSNISVCASERNCQTRRVYVSRFYSLDPTGHLKRYSEEKRVSTFDLEFNETYPRVIFGPSEFSV